MTFEFDRATRLASDDGRRFHGEIAPGWDINDNANGGYLIALAAAAMREASGRPDPITITAHYLAPGKVGPVTIDTDVVKSGRRFVTMTGSMRSGERELLRLIGNFGDLATTAGGIRLMEREPPDLPPIEQCVPRSPQQGGVVVRLLDRLKVAIRPSDAGFTIGERSGVPSVQGWFEFADGRPIDTLALLLVADAFPPAVFNVDIPVGWVPTVELTVHVRGVPAPGPMRCRFDTHFVQNGFLQEDSEVWDSSGQLVAQSRQLALMPRE